MANFFQDIVDKFQIPTGPTDQVLPTSIKDALVQKQKYTPTSQLPTTLSKSTNFFQDIIDKHQLTPTSNYTPINELPLHLPQTQVKPETNIVKNAKSLIGLGKNVVQDVYQKLNTHLEKTPIHSLGKFLERKQLTKQESDDVKMLMMSDVTSSLESTALKVASPAIKEAETYVADLMKQKAVAEGEKIGIGTKVNNFLKLAKTKLVDFASPIEDILSATTKKSKITLLPKYDITNQIDRVLRSPTLAGQFARDNGLEQVIKQVDNLNNLGEYLIAKHVKKVASLGIETGRNLEKDQHLATAFKEKYEPLAQQVTQYSQKLLDYVTDSGLISKDLSTKLKQIYPDYVPLNRIFSELEKDQQRYGSKAIASLSKQSIVQRIEGSQRTIENPIASLLSKTNDAFQQGEKNKAAQLLTSYHGLPGNPFQLRKLNIGEVKQAGEDTINVLVNGVREVWATTKPVAEAAKNLNSQQLNILGKIFALPVRLARIGITGINLPFVASNIARDQLTGLINSKNAVRTSFANPYVFGKALFEAVGHGELYAEAVRAGAMGTSFDIARSQIPQTIERMRSGKSVVSKIIYTVKHPGELLRSVEDIVGRSEELTRLQQYVGTKQALLKQGMDEKNAIVGAAQASRENTVNFARRGEWGTVLNSAFLYLNAGIQGTRTLLRNLSERPIQTGTKIALGLFSPVAITTLWNISDPKRKNAYQDIADFEKQNNIIIIPPNPTKDAQGRWNIIKIPISQEVNNIASLVRIPIEQAHNMNELKVHDLVRGLIGTITPVNNPETALGWASTLTPQAIKPTIEGLTNKNLFTGRNLVPQSMQNLSPELQAKSYTSGTAREIGRGLNISPIKVEEWIKGTAGGVGSQILHASDLALAGMDIIPKDQIGGQSVISAILARFSKAVGGEVDKQTTDKLQTILTNQADERFRLKQEAEVLFTELKNGNKDEAISKLKELATKNPDLLAKLQDTITENMKGLNYQDRLVLQLGVENGERAKFIYTTFDGMKTNDEKKSYLVNLKNKGILTDKVLTQFLILTKK